MNKPCFRSKDQPCTCQRPMRHVSNERLIDTVLWTSDNMFGDIIFDAEEELRHRREMPKWAFGKDPWK